MALVPDVNENGAVAEDKTRSGALGLMVPLTPRVAVAGFAAESVTTSVKPKSLAADGVPLNCPFDSVRPAGSASFTLNVYGAVPPSAVRICAG